MRNNKTKANPYLDVPAPLLATQRMPEVQLDDEPNKSHNRLTK